MMKKLFGPILDHFEQGEDDYLYKKSHRTILIAVGSLFMFLVAILVVIALATEKFAALFPIAIFLGAGLVCLVVGSLGSDRAVAKIWGNTKK